MNDNNVTPTRDGKTTETEMELLEARRPMDKLKMRTPSFTDKNFAALAALFPNAVTEAIDENGAVVRAIDKDVLAQEINAHVVEGREERYQFTWPDKRKSILLANAPIAAALRPCREESVDFDATENLYIEGDNLDVLKLLRETYLNRVKMIYIDPPYNTGHDFVYEDDFAEDAGDFLRRDGQYDEQGNRLAANLDSNGRFHTDWLNMMYPRLRVARDFLTDDGVIFISIDDNEQENTKKVCNEIFGVQNFVAQLIWQRAFSPKNDSRFISNSHDYVLMYAKNINSFVIGRLPRTEEANARYSNPDNDPRGVWMSSDISVKTYNPNTDYPITAPSGRVIEPPTGRCWSLSKNEFLERLQDNRIWFGPDGDGAPRIKRFLSDLKFDGMAPTSIMLFKDVGHSQEGSQEVTKLLEAGVFDGPKPVRLLRRLLTLANLEQDSIILDFFSGSATTAHAVMQLNAEDGGKRKFIMVQLPEVCAEGTEAAKAGYKNICEIGKERIRRAGAKINAEFGRRNAELESGQALLFDENSEFRTPHSELDVGFRVLKLDSSNMKDVYYTPEKLLAIANRQRELFKVTDNIKPDRSPEDLLFQVMLDLGVPLSAKITQEGNVFHVNDNYLIACFDQVDTALITEIAKKKAFYAVFRDSSFASDSDMVNFEQVFNTYSPNTIRRVL
jgi:adenine-specific DNA-methyltransferase